MKILVVDDNPQDRALVVRELRSEFRTAEIWEAINQRQLEEHLENNEIDLVVTDYQLHWTDGILVLKRVKAKWPDCPVIMFTATGNEEIAVDGMRQGLDDYITKSVKHLVRLRAATHAVLDHAATRRRAKELAARLGSLLSQLRVGVFSCTANGDFLDVNHAMRQLSDAIRRGPTANLCDLFSGDPRAARLLARAVESDAPQECEIDVAGEGGLRKCFQLSVARADGESGIPRIDGLLEDVTHRKQSEAELRESEVAAAKIDMLTPREKHVLDEVVRGRPNKETANVLKISEKTVEKHRSNVMRKLRVRSVAELVRLTLLAEKVRC